MLQHARLRLSSPQPAQRLRQYRAPVLVGVAAVPELEPVVVAAELEGGRHLLVRERPVAEAVVQVVRSVLEENAYGPVRRLADQRGVDVAAADVGKLPMWLITLRKQSGR